MAEPWTPTCLHDLDALVDDLRTRPLTAADVPALYRAFLWQHQVLQEAYRVVGQQVERITALEEEVETLRRLVAGAGSASRDDPDERPW